MAAVTTYENNRTSNEVAAVRARALELLAYTEAHPEGVYADHERRRCESVRDTLDWITGARAESPATGNVVAPDADGLRRERMRGEDLENERRRRGGDSVTPGVAALTILWFLRDPDGGDNPV